MARILVVDDDAAIRRALARFLERSGHEVSQASNGQKALALLETNDPDLVITDINMPEMDGIELILAFQEKRPDLAVIAISGGGFIDRSSLLADAAGLGAVSTLEKPFSLTEVEAAVESALAGT